MDIRIHAVGTANQILAARRDGRVALSRAATQAFACAEAILEADAMLGAICCADLYDATIPQMAQNAYAIAVIARDLDGMQLIDMDGDDRIFFSEKAVEMSMSGFCIVAVL